MITEEKLASLVTRKRKKKPKLPWPACASPIAASILCVDPGKVSGWAIWRNGQPVRFGHVDVFGDPMRIEGVLAEFICEPGPHLVVIERPFGAGHGNASTAVGAGDVIWRSAVERFKLKPRLVRVYPSQWRCKALGKGWGSAAREKVRKQEQAVALHEVCSSLPGYADNLQTTEIHSDAAPAICMGRWASYAGECIAKLPKPRARKAVA
jgi:hypothetical protein